MIIVGVLTAFTLNTNYFFQGETAAKGQSGTAEPGSSHLCWIAKVSSPV